MQTFLGGKGQKTFQVFEFEYTYLEKVTCQGALRPRERLQIELVFGWQNNDGVNFHVAWPKNLKEENRKLHLISCWGFTILNKLSRGEFWAANFIPPANAKKKISAYKHWIFC